MFSSTSMDDAVMYMMAFPPGVIAMCLVFKAYGASHKGFLTELSNEHHENFFSTFNRSNIGMYMILAFVAHTAIHWFLLRFVVMPKAETKQEELRKQSSKDLT